MKKIVISLSSALDRRNHIKQEFTQKNLDFEFFDAIQPDTLLNCENKLGLSLKNSSLTENEKSCFMSHFFLWNKIVNENLDFVAIFEDDIYLSDNAETFLNTNVLNDYDFIKIEKTTNNVLLHKQKKYKYKNVEYQVGILKSKHTGTGGYILSHNGAKKIIDFVRSQTKLDHIDQVMFDCYRVSGNVNIYQINPVLCIQDCILYPNNQKFTSSLEWRNIKYKKMAFYKKIIREVRRFVVKILTLPYKVNLYFNSK